jgi:hypothetical protein
VGVVGASSLVISLHVFRRAVSCRQQFVYVILGNQAVVRDLSSNLDDRLTAKCYCSAELPAVVML